MPPVRRLDLEQNPSPSLRRAGGRPAATNPRGQEELTDYPVIYKWSDPTLPLGPASGSVFTSFLSRLNGSIASPGLTHPIAICGSTDGTSVSGGFAGHCDWRLPTIVELQTILPPPCATRLCIDSIFGPTAGNYYWSATTDDTEPSVAWVVWFGLDGGMDGEFKDYSTYVRAVRAGL